MRKISFLFVIVFFLTTFSSCHSYAAENNNTVMQLCYDSLRKELKEKLCVEAYPEDWTTGSREISYVYIGASYNKEIKSIEEARKLIVDTTNLVVNFLDKDERIRPYLQEYPFSQQKIYIVIALDKNMKLNEPIVEVSYYRGTVDYFYEYDRIQVPKETFGEAKAKIASRKDTIIN